MVLVVVVIHVVVVVVAVVVLYSDSFPCTSYSAVCLCAAKSHGQTNFFWKKLSKFSYESCEF